MNMKKILAFVLSLVLVAGLSIAGTVAYLTSVTGEVKNTFTVGDIEITLTETTGSTYHIVPGKNISKNPTVGVGENSEPCWLFVTVTEENWPTVKNADGSLKVSYAIDSAWTKLEDGVYYMKVASSAAAQSFAVLANNTVVVSDELMKDEITAQPTLAFKAYAIQQEGFANAADAWAEVGE